MDKVLILDFGAQYNQLIARRVREAKVYCEIVPYDISISDVKKTNPGGIILYWKDQGTIQIKPSYFPQHDR